MRTTSRVALTSLVLGLMTAGAMAAPDTTNITTSISTINQLSGKASDIESVGIEMNRLGDLFYIMNDGQLGTEQLLASSPAEITAFVSKMKAKYQAEQDDSSPAGVQARDMLKVIEDESTAVADLVKIRAHFEEGNKLPLAREELRFGLKALPLLQSSEQHYVQHALDQQVHLGLLNSLHSHTGREGAFGIVNGNVTSDGKLGGSRNLLSLGYNHFFPAYQANLALLGNVVTGKTSETTNGADFTVSQSGFGVGGYADVQRDGFRLSSLLTLNKGSSEVGINTNYSSLLNGLVAAEQANYQDLAVASGSSKADTTITNFLAQVDYSWKVQPQLTVTPSLTYHFHHFSPATETTTLTKGSQDIVTYSKTSPFVPVITTHGLGAGVDLSYALSSNFTLGWDVSMMYYSNNLSYFNGAFKANVSSTGGSGTASMGASGPVLSSSYAPGGVIVGPGTSTTDSALLGPDGPGGTTVNPSDPSNGPGSNVGATPGEPSSTQPGNGPDGLPQPTPMPGSGPDGGSSPQPVFPGDVNDNTSGPNGGPDSARPDASGPNGPDFDGPEGSGVDSPFAPSNTTYTTTVTAQDKVRSYLNFTSNLKLTYQVNPNLTVQGKVGYADFSEIEQKGFHYNLSLGWKF